MTTIAALYVDARGPYPKMPDVDCWDAERDARNYLGPHAVVAHPPCGPWGKLASWCTKQDASLGPIAVHQVRTFGGVLEHPANSSLFDACNMPYPGELPDGFGGWSLAVEQVSWGHVARKATWLYFVGVSRDHVRPLRGGEPTHRISGLDRMASARGLRSTLKQCSKPQARRTPPRFAQWLVDLARTVQRA